MVDMHEEPRGCTRSVVTVAAALICGTTTSAVVVAAAFAASRSSARSSPDSSTSAASGFVSGADDPSRRNRRSGVCTFLWTSVGCLLLAWTVLGLFHSSTRIRLLLVKWQLTAHDRAVPIRAVLYIVLALLTFSLGVFGLWTPSAVSSTDQPLWPTVVAAATAAAWVVAGVALLAMGVVAAVQDIRTGQETPPALVLLRCSCCSVAAKRALVALPFAVLSAVSGALWASAHRSGADAGCAEAARPAHLLLGSAVIFGTVVVSLAVAALHHEVRVRNPQSTLAQRRRGHAANLGMLLLFGFAAIGWSAASWQWLRGHSGSGVPHEASCVTEGTVASVRVTAWTLLVVGVLLLTTTCCCRLERHLLPTANTPQVDMAMLSPHALRPPALTKSPTDHVV